MNWLDLIFLVFLQVAKPAPVPGLPADAGVYVHHANAEWTRMDTAAMADMKSKGMGEFLETDGYTNLTVTVTYLGAEAKLQIPDPRPVFVARGTGASRDAMIILLTRRKDSRTVRTDSSLATVENRAGFRKDDIQPVTVTVYSDESFSITPDKDLKPGEYALAFGFPNAAYDFSIIRPRK